MSKKKKKRWKGEEEWEEKEKEFLFSIFVPFGFLTYGKSIHLEEGEFLYQIH